MRAHPRLSRRHPIEIYCEARQQKIDGYAENISAGGMLVAGAACMRKDDLLSITLHSEVVPALVLKGRVVRQDGSHCAVSFVEISPATTKQLQELLTPHWDGHDLLEGVIRISPWIEENSLAGWMRYTSLLAGWHPVRTRGDASPGLTAD